MQKDHDIKQNPQYNCESLRRRINEGVKRLRDEAAEAKRPPVKQYFLIPVTGTARGKFENNKGQYKFEAND